MTLTKICITGLSNLHERDISPVCQPVPSPPVRVGVRGVVSRMRMHDAHAQLVVVLIFCCYSSVKPSGSGSQPFTHVPTTFSER